jgi:hypothetical protein
MKRAGISVIAGLVFSAISCATFARAQESMPKPSPEHKKLDALAGSWSIEGDVKPNPMGQAGKMTEDEKCEWMEGGFFLICHVTFQSPNMGSGTAVSVIGYSTSEKLYTYREFNSWGETEDSRGRVEGDTWTWSNDEKMGTSMVKARFTMKFTSPTAYTFMYETSPDGDKWTDLVDGKATKK